MTKATKEKKEIALTLNAFFRLRLDSLRFALSSTSWEDKTGLLEWSTAPQQYLQ